MRDDSNYLDAFKEVADQSKGSVAIASVPLGIVLVQLRYLAAVDSFWLQIFATIAVIALFISTLIAWFIAVSVQATLAMELYKRDGKVMVKGQSYLGWMQGLSKDKLIYTEDYVVRVSKALVGPFWASALLGYLALFVLVLSLIWSTP